MLTPIPLYSGKKMSRVRTVVVSSCPDPEFAKVGDCSINVFTEFSRFEQINSKPLIDSPILSEYLSGNYQSRFL